MNDHGARATARLVVIFVGVYGFVGVCGLVGVCGCATRAQAAPATHDSPRLGRRVTRVLAARFAGADSRRPRQSERVHALLELTQATPAVVNVPPTTSHSCGFAPGRPGRAKDDEDDDDDDDDRKGWGGLFGALTLLYSQRKRFGL